MDLNRRHFVAAAGATAAGGAAALLAGAAPSASATTSKTAVFTPPAGPRSRVIIHNDLASDPDGLFATVHGLLSTSTDVRAVIGAHALQPTDPFDPTTTQATDAYQIAVEILKLMGRTGQVAAYAGANTALANASTPNDSAGAQAIVAEAMRTDTKLPLYVTAGGSLTDIASAYLIEPKIQDNITLIWIGGAPYPGGGPEYNLNADRVAAQVIFNDSKIPIWQVPSDVYSMCMVSMAELEAYVQPADQIGAWLYGTLLNFFTRSDKFINFGEAYQLGDSPLVLLSALTSAWASTATYSSPYNTVYAPHINDDGTYTAQTSGRQIRAYTSLDNRLMYSDFFAKLANRYRH